MFGRRRRDWLALAAVSIVVLLPMRGLWRAPGPPMEEGFMLVFPEQVLHGAIPNRDFLHLYGPGSLWVLAAVFKTLGTSMWTERAVGLIQQLALVAGVYTITRPWGRRMAAGGAAITAIIILPPAGLTAMAWVGGAALALWAMIAALRGRPLVAGLLAGVALLYRPDLVIAVTLGLGVLWGALAARERKRLLAGAGLGLSPFLLHVALAGPGHALFGMVIQPVFQLRSGRRLPLPPSLSQFDGFLQRAGELNALEWPISWPPRPSQLTIWLALVVGSAVLLATVGWRVGRHGPAGVAGRALLVMGAFSIGLLPQALQRPDSTHLAWVGAVPLGLLPVAVSELLRASRPSLRKPTRLLIAAAMPSILLLALVPHFTFGPYADLVLQTFDRHREVYVMHNDGRSFYYGRHDAADAVNAMLPVVDQIVKPGDKLFVGTGDLRKTPYSEAYLYYLLPRTRPGTRYIEMDPAVANRENSGLADDLASSDIVILSSIRDDWNEPNASLDVGSDQATQVLNSQFCKVGSWGQGLFGRGLYELYERCDRQ
ncbi:MAG: hypothetical protein QOD92_3386 [Acidimicrobiaceae bacterium]|jgi:hypothetical protein